MIGTMTTVSHLESRREYHDQFENLGKSFAVQMQANSDLVVTAYDRLKNNKGSDDSSFKIMQRQLEAMVQGSAIRNAYLFMPERSGGNELVTMQSSLELAGEGLTPGAVYKMESYFLTGYEQAMKDGAALTEPFVDTIGEWISYLAPIKDDSGKVIALFGVDFDNGEVEHKLLRMLLESIGMAALFLLGTIVIVAIMLRVALKPLRRLAELSRMAAQGDLTVSVPVTSGNEIGQAAESFNAMIVSLRDLAVQIHRNSAEVAASAVHLQESAGQTAEATQEIVDAIQQVASGADTQLQSSQECQRAMTEMTIGIQRIAESSTLVSELAAESAASASDGRSVMGKAVEQMRVIERELHESVEVISELKQLGDNIGEITSLITDISNQTNLLALNASIEAARAGEHGKGFAVVGQEIRKLAERSRVSSDQIQSMLEGIGQYTAKAAESLERSREDARTGSAAAGEAGEMFGSIVASTRRVSEQVQEISASSQQMSAGSEQIAASMLELETIATTSSQHSDRVAASSEEQLASMQAVAGAADQLRVLADGLQQAIDRFRV
ncbi:methyl-accepting chemotaxis protein [Paenibacillus ginsengarvi]|uniref:methyl-accepting chemotaxis protein n=1 Tax=Paenibacillus ginsengarvi TaxID=400777 RepID=UPI00195FD2E3|nr:methyl-accepting chemotaxis protein [Paenibacillus ginsengarvi]